MHTIAPVVACCIVHRMQLLGIKNLVNSWYSYCSHYPTMTLLTLELIVICCSLSQLLEFSRVAALTTNLVTVSTNDSEVGSCLLAHNRASILSSMNNNIIETLTELVTVPQCGDGLWYQVAYLNMNDSTQECPFNWMEGSTPSVRGCGRPTSTGASCSGEYFSTGSLQYSKVCGRVIGYQNGSTDSFNKGSPHSIDEPYVDGVSVTHGVPRVHIWTFSAGATESRYFFYPSDCPCAYPGGNYGTRAPSFVGDNYFCESGNPGVGLQFGGVIFDADPVWDGEMCEGECCSNGKSPPWFSVTLPNPTYDDIEVRICGDEDTRNEDTPIQLLEMYIQ